MNNNNLKNMKLNPNWVIGFTDAEGCFRISIIKNKNSKGKALPLSVRLYFQIGLHRKDEAILKLIRSELGVGKIYRGRKYSSELQVSSFKDSERLIDYFEKYPLITQKLADYLLFKQAFELIKNKEHLTMKGLNKLVAIKASINWGLPDGLKKAFPDVDPVKRLNVVHKETIDPNWLAGFTSGEGSFLVRLFDSSHNITGSQVQLRFQITQQSRDLVLMENIVKYFSCGNISKRGDIIDIHVTKFSDITEKIIPLFEKYPVIGVKKENFYDFCKVAELMKKKAHLTKEGLEQIREIRKNMNSYRESYQDEADLV